MLSIYTGAGMLAIWHRRQWDQFCGVSCFNMDKISGESEVKKHYIFGVMGRSGANSQTMVLSLSRFCS